jgi:hypothetical protein
MSFVKQVFIVLQLLPSLFHALEENIVMAHLLLNCALQVIIALQKRRFQTLLMVLLEICVWKVTIVQRGQQYQYHALLAPLTHSKANNLSMIV